MKKTQTISDRPDLMAKWAAKENEEIGLFPYNLTIGSGKKAYWRCVEHRHLYERSIRKEVSRKPMCPVCRMEKKQTISDRPDLMVKWATKENDEIGLSPYDLTIGSNKKSYWRCEEHGHLYEMCIKEEAEGKRKCPVCKHINQKYLSDYPELLEEFAFDINEVAPEELTSGSDVSVAWRCKKCGNVWKTAVYHRVKKKSGCPYCANKKVLKGFNDIATIKPLNYKYWDFDKNEKYGILPHNYTPASRKKAWWFCDKGHSTFEVIGRVIDRKKNHCSECMRLAKEESKKKRLETENRIVTKEIRLKKEKERAKKIKAEKINALPAALIKFWDHEENSKRGFELIAVNNQRLYNFKCPKGHTWKSDLDKLSENGECPICFIEKNSIASKYHYLIDNFDIKKNGDILPEKCLAIDTKYYWWKCRQGHSFIAMLKNVAKHKETGCMYCDKEKSYYSV